MGEVIVTILETCKCFRIMTSILLSLSSDSQAAHRDNPISIIMVNSIKIPSLLASIAILVL
jgi:hypothetical protein